MTIHNHPLAWRWTDPKHTELPAEILAQIHPLAPSAAALIYDQWTTNFDKSGKPIPSRFPQTETCSTETSPAAHIINWLRTHEPDLTLPVKIAWNHNWAVRTTWAIFTQSWDTFCYPNCDDVLITPDPPRCLLAFHHEERFTFCRFPAASGVNILNPATPRRTANAG